MLHTFINHESDHSQKEKLVVSPAINQVVQSLSVRLLRVDYFAPPSYGLLTSRYPWDSAAVSIVFVGAAPARATPSPTSRRSSLYSQLSQLATRNSKGFIVS